MTDTTTTLDQGHADPGRDDDDAGGPSHPAPGHLPPQPEPETGPERHDDEPGGPSHPAPGHLPPASPENLARRP
jgi:hypothetical protein